MVGPAKAYWSVGAVGHRTKKGDTHSARSRHSLSYVSSACSAAGSIQRFPDLIFTHTSSSEVSYISWCLGTALRIPRFHSTLNLETFPSSSEMRRTPPINLSRSNLPLCPHPYPKSKKSFFSLPFMEILWAFFFNDCILFSSTWNPPTFLIFRVVPPSFQKFIHLVALCFIFSSHPPPMKSHSFAFVLSRSHAFLLVAMDYKNRGAPKGN